MSDQKIKSAAAKAPLGLIPQRALVGAARVFGYGARKYAPGNYYAATLGDGAGQRYISAALRHLAEMQEPNGLHTDESLAALDPESGLPHLDHVLCGLMMLRSIMVKDGVLEVDPGIGLDPPGAFDRYVAERKADPEFAEALEAESAEIVRRIVTHEIGECDCRDCESLRMKTTCPMIRATIDDPVRLSTTAPLPVVHDMVAGKCPDEPHTHSWNVPLTLRAESK